MNNEITGHTISELTETNLDGTEEILIEKGAKNYKTTLNKLVALLPSTSKNKTVMAFKSSAKQPTIPVNARWDLLTDEISFEEGDGWGLNLSSSVSTLAQTEEISLVVSCNSYLTIDGYVPRYSAYGWNDSAGVGSSLTTIRKSFSSGMDRSTDRSFFFQFSGKLKLGKKDGNALYFMLFSDLSQVCTCASNDKLEAISINLYKSDSCIASYDLLPNACAFGGNSLLAYIDPEQYADIQKQVYDSYSFQFKATIAGNIEAKTYADESQISQPFVSYITNESNDIPLWLSVGYFNSATPDTPEWSVPLHL